VAAFTARLRPSWREFFELSFVQGLDHEAVRERLGLGRLRCKYMRQVLAARARRSPALLTALGRQVEKAGDDAP
jgi:hypothetical protein